MVSEGLECYGELGCGVLGLGVEVCSQVEYGQGTESLVLRIAVVLYR